MISRSTHLVFFSLETQIAQRVVTLLKVNVSKWNVVSHFGSTSLRVCSPQTHCVFVARKHKISPTGIAQPLVQISVWCGSSEVGGRSTDRAPSLFPSWCCSPSHDCHDIITIWKNQQLYLYPPHSVIRFRWAEGGSKIIEMKVVYSPRCHSVCSDECQNVVFIHKNLDAS